MNTHSLNYQPELLYFRHRIDDSDREKIRSKAKLTLARILYPQCPEVVPF